MATGGERELYAQRGDGRPLLRLVSALYPTESDWFSHYQLGARPRKAEITNAMDHMGLSFWEAPEPLVWLSNKYPQLGTFIAEVEIRGECGIWFTESGRGHYTVWGRPADLQRCCRLPATPV